MMYNNDENGTQKSTQIRYPSRCVKGITLINEKGFRLEKGAVFALLMKTWYIWNALLKILFGSSPCAPARKDPVPCGAGSFLSRRESKDLNNQIQQPGGLLGAAALAGATLILAQRQGCKQVLVPLPGKS